jgi:hypothetical protein
MDEHRVHQQARQKEYCRFANSIRHTIFISLQTGALQLATLPSLRHLAATKIFTLSINFFLFFADFNAVTDREMGKTQQSLAFGCYIREQVKGRRLKNSRSW